MSVAANKRKALALLTVANLVSCPVYLALWLFLAAARANGHHAAWQALLLNGFLAAAAGCTLLPMAAWVLAGRHPRTALGAILAPHALAASAFVLACAMSLSRVEA